MNNERLVTKTALNKINGTEQAYSDYEKSHTYYYHSDHLGSATLITDYKGKEYQRIEYTPYEESWIELSKNIDNYLPYRFTGKELDEETGFYYYGQRYLDPRYSIWHTSDPAIYDYMSQSKEGEGGIYNMTNLNLYHYAGNNPVKYIDPDGRFLYISRDEDFMRDVKTNLQELSPDALVIKIEDDLAMVLLSGEEVDSEHSEGAKLISSLVTDINNTVTIKNNNNGNKYKISTNEVLFDLNSNPTILTMQPDGTSEYEHRPNYIGLAHELVHALHDTNNVVNFRTYREAIGLDGNNYNFRRMYNKDISFEELGTVGGISGFNYGSSYPTENSIRAEHGLKLRTIY